MSNQHDPHQQEHDHRPDGNPEPPSAQAGGGQPPQTRANEVAGWSQAIDVARRDDQVASKYVRLANDGDQATIMVLQPPLGYFAHRLSEGGRFAGWSRCPGQCASCEKGRAVGRYLLDVFDVEARARKLWEPGKLTFRALEALARRYSPQATLYEVTRHGRAGDQRTRYQLLPAGPVTSELRAIVDKTRPYDLEAESWGENRRQDDETSSAGLPF